MSGGAIASGSGSNQDSFEPKGINQPTRFDGTKATQVPDFIDKLVDWAEATGLGYSPGPKMSVKRYCALVSQNLAEGPATVWYKGFKAAFELKAELIYFCDGLRAHFGVHFEHEMALRLGMTLFGRAANRRFLCYSGFERFDAAPDLALRPPVAAVGRSLQPPGP